MSLSTLNNKQRKVYIVGFAVGYRSMWERSGFLVTDKLADADIVNFTGGEDVSPQLYGERNISSHCNPKRDAFETEVYHAARAQGKFIVGICRGGQFLNVMNGGKMWQDVDNHTSSHIAIDIASGKEFWVTSTHHQMMRPHEDALILMTASLASQKVSADDAWTKGASADRDIEAVFYNKTRSLCFQPHPEFSNAADCLRAFMMYVRDCYLDETYRKAS